jgi:hypothetical protein
MPAVAINNSYVDLPEMVKKEAFSVGFNGTFRVESKRTRLPIIKDDHLIVVKPENNELLFINSGTITSIGKVENAPLKLSAVNPREKSEPSYYHYFDFHIDKALKENNLLSQLEYSLPIVEDYIHPEVHFQSQFRGLSDNDFDTIVNGWVYATRTVFGKLFNSLPRQNKLEFMIQAMDKFSTVDFKDKTLLEGLEFLYEYIERRILSRGRLLVATDDILTKKFGGLLPASEIGLIDPETKVVHKIAPQADIFRQLITLEKENSLKESLNKTLNINQGLESRFQKLFNRRGWPIDLSK